MDGLAGARDPPAAEANERHFGFRAAIECAGYAARYRQMLKQRDFPGYATLMMGMKDYAHIGVPALAIFANPHSLGAWVDTNTDPAIVKPANVYSAALSTLTARQEQSFQRGVPGARLVTLPNANHYVYLSNEADVLQAISGFLRAVH